MTASTYSCAHAPGNFTRSHLSTDLSAILENTAVIEMSTAKGLLT